MKRILTFRLNIVSKKKIKENLEEKKRGDHKIILYIILWKFKNLGETL